jgi:4a-hydroxytetrahydrobiopterin dehydratase
MMRPRTLTRRLEMRTPPAGRAAARVVSMAHVLTADDLSTRLAMLDGWSSDGLAITRTVELPSFVSAIEVVDRVADVAEAMDHHPDIDIRWRTLTFACSTHSLGGVTDKDFELAHRINEIVAVAAT